MPFDLQPALEGELLRLRPLRPEDLHDLYAVASDPLVWEQHPNSDRYKEEVFREFFREALESGGARFVKSVVFLVGPKNVRSQKALEKIGAVRTGSRLDGVGRESLVYRITAS